MSLADWMRLAVALAWVFLFVAALRSCAALESIAHELRRANAATLGPEPDAGAP